MDSKNIYHLDQNEDRIARKNELHSLYSLYYPAVSAICISFLQLNLT